MTEISQKTASATPAITLGSALPWILATLFLFIAPQIFSSNSAITIMNQMGITIVFALAYNMLLGQGGMLSFGHAVYMGVGGFACVHIMNMDDFFSKLPLPLLPIFGGVIGMLFAAIVGSFSTRKAGTVFAMISLGVGELVAACSVIIVIFFGGEEGISGDRTYGLPFFGVEFLQQIEVYYLTSFWLLVSAFLMYLFSRTPVGRMANAVRDNPERAEFLGYSSRWVRFYSFVASGFFCGIAGGLFAINFEILTEENLNLATSGSILLMTFLGGAGFFFGPVLGVVTFVLLLPDLGLQTGLWALYVGALFLATVMFFPGGLSGLIMMHVTPIRLGKMHKLYVPYLKVFIPAIIGTLSLCSFVEILFHARHAALGEEEMTIFWTTFNSHSAVAWILTIAVAVGGIWLAKLSAPELNEAWHDANTPDGGAA